MSTVRVRFAPKPTGHLHIGGARTAIYNWAFARHHGGDVRPAHRRHRPRALDRGEHRRRSCASLRWLGLDWDEGPEVGGEYGPYFQTQRADSYARCARAHEGSAATRTRASAPPRSSRPSARLRARQGRLRGLRPRRAARSIPPTAAARIAAGEPHVWRLAVPEDRGDIVFDDAVRGEMTFPGDAMDDFVLVRTDGTPTYNFATVVDDVDMGITHVIRGDDHLSNTPRQIVVYEALEAPVPLFAHLSMISGPDGKRLSKRHGATSSRRTPRRAILPEALLNYLALLGWSLDGETTIFDRETLVRELLARPHLQEPRDLRCREARVDERRLHPRAARRGVRRAHDRRGSWSAGLVDAADAASAPTGSPASLRSSPSASSAWTRSCRRSRSCSPSRRSTSPRARRCSRRRAPRERSAAVAERPGVGAVRAPRRSRRPLRTVPERLGLKPKAVFQAVRVAVTGSTVSPPLFESLELLGKRAYAAPESSGARPLRGLATAAFSRVDTA